MGPRVTLVEADQAPLLVRHLFEAGDPGVIVRALATVPELAEVAVPFIGMALGPGSVEPAVKETVILRTSAVLGCRYCVEAHTVVALDMGLGTERVRTLRDTAPDARTTTDPAAADPLVAWIDAVAGGRGPVPDDLHAALSEGFAEHQVVELLVTLGATTLLNRLCSALALPTSPATLARLAAEGFGR
ncbi:MAG: carboxymuconolactone decarboxylase family protein [Acidimicrobiales bacterium]